MHPRLIAAGAEHLELDHYLEILSRKPGALPGAAALAQARASGAFTAAHQGFWDRARARLGDGAGTRALIEVLLLHRRMPAAQVTAGIRAALAAGSCSADVVAIEARKHAGLASPGQASEAVAGAAPAAVAGGGGHPATARGTAARRPAPGPVGGRLRPAARPARRR